MSFTYNFHMAFYLCYLFFEKVIFLHGVTLANWHTMRKKKNNAKKCFKYFNGSPALSIGCFLYMVIHKYYHSMTMQFHQGTSQSTGYEPHTTDGESGAALRTLCALLTGYTAAVTLSPVWCRINKRHASTFCWNICDREISGIFPDNFCVLDQIFIRTLKPGKRRCCVWFFNKLGHAFVKGVRKRGLWRLFSIIKSSQNIWQITK